MRFSLLDRICSFEPHTQLTSVKSVSLAEEYLADHFPEFPVLPGVFMLEAATQSAAWLVRLSEDFAHSMVVLQEARSVKFTDFVVPGRTLQMTVQQTDRSDNIVKFSFQGQVDDRTSVSGRLTLCCSNLADEDPQQAELDVRMQQQQRETAKLLLPGHFAERIANS
jgi:3-hydroxyacyl-[acyl-carrier-protein] dehydratase